MKKILIQLDTDPQPSSFDAVTAIDAGIDQLLQYAQVNTSNVVPLVQGAIFTRGVRDLQNTAIFVGGNDAEQSQEVFETVKSAFVGPMTVSAMMDASGCNTTAAASVVYISKHLPLTEVNAVVLGGTGSVGQRVVEILASQGGKVTVVSRSIGKARGVCMKMAGYPHQPQAAELPSTGAVESLLEDANVLVCAGAVGAKFTSVDRLQTLPGLKLAIDLNAVPPLGIEGISVGDKAKPFGDLICYGAVGIGGLKMRIHHGLISRMFTTNDHWFDTTQIFEAAVNM